MKECCKTNLDFKEEDNFGRGIFFCRKCKLEFKAFALLKEKKRTKHRYEV